LETQEEKEEEKDSESKKMKEGRQYYEKLSMNELVSSGRKTIDFD
jgi:hypothetical protein